MIGWFLSKLDQTVPVVNRNGDAVMFRYYLLKTRWGGLNLHLFLPGADDTCFHDHPWQFVTLILSGGYRERMPNGARWRPAGTLLYRAPNFAHAVEVDRPCWSLVWVGPKVRKWGFLTNKGWQPWIKDQAQPICE